MSLLFKTTPYERHTLKCIWSQDFQNTADLNSTSTTQITNLNHACNKGLVLDTTNNYKYTYCLSPCLDINNYTIIIKMKLGFSSIATGSSRFFIVFQPPATLDNTYIACAASSDNLIAFRSTVGGTAYDSTFTKSWNIDDVAVIVVSRTSGSTKMYWNGVYIAPNTSPTYGPSLTGSTYFYLGHGTAANRTSGTYYYVKIFNKVLSEADILKYT
jgi:hypothetical protein